MKRQIRRSVFETNSSSMHSLTVRKEGVSGIGANGKMKRK